MQKGHYGAVVSGFTWQLAAKIAIAAIRILSITLLARILSPHDYGLFAVLATVIALNALIVDGSVSTPLIQRKEINPALVSSAFAVALAIGACFAAILASASGSIEKLFGFSGLSNIFLFGSVTVLFSAFEAVPMAMLKKERRFRLVAMATTISSATYLPVALSLALKGFGVWSLVAAQIVQAVVESSLVFALCRPQLTRPTAAYVREIAVSSWAPTLQGLLNWLALSSSTLIIGRNLGPVPLGYFNRANTLFNLTQDLIAGPVFATLFSTFSNLQQDAARLRMAVIRALAVGLPVLFLIAACILQHADTVVHILMGSKWLPVATTLSILFMAFPARVGYKISESVSFALGKFRGGALRQAFFAVAVLTGVSIGTAYGLNGAAMGFAIAIWLFFILSLTQLVSAAGISWRPLLIILARSIAVGLLYLILSRLVILLSGRSDTLSNISAAALAGPLCLAFLFFGPERMVGAAGPELRKHLVERYLARRRKAKPATP